MSMVNLAVLAHLVSPLLSTCTCTLTRFASLQGNIKITWQNMQFADDERIDWDEFVRK